MFTTLVRRSSSCSASHTPPLSPVRWTYLPDQVPYHLGLLLQEHLVQSRLSAKAALLSPTIASTTNSYSRTELERIASTDVLLLLQHRPVYTAGKREKDPVTASRERDRLGKLGADYVQTSRGGQTTYHGPGQLVGYPLLDLGASRLSTRCYVDKLEKFLEELVASFSVPIDDVPHTGVFVTPTTKIASIGVQIRRRITMHGFSINVEQQTKHWFDQIVACGLHDVQSTSVEAELKRLGKLGPDGQEVKVGDAVEKAVKLFGRKYQRELKQLEVGDEFEVTRKLIDDGINGRLPEMKRELLGV